MPEQPPRVRHLQSIVKGPIKEKFAIKPEIQTVTFKGNCGTFLFRPLICVVIYYCDVTMDLK